MALASWRSPPQAVNAMLSHYAAILSAIRLPISSKCQSILYIRGRAFVYILILFNVRLVSVFIFRFLRATEGT